MCSEPPLLSLIIPAYNSGDTLGAALGSLLNQQFDDFEVIVVDDASGDTTAEVVAAMYDSFGGRLKLISLPGNVGAAKAYSHGLKLVTGRYVGRLDADDEIPPGAFAAMAAIARSTESEVIWGGLVTDGRYTPPPASTDLNSCSIDVDHFSLCNKWIERELAVKFPPLYDRWDDLSSVARILALRPSVVTVDRPVYNYIRRKRGDSLSTASQQALLEDHIATARALDDWFVANCLDGSYRQFLLHLKFAAKVKLLRCRPRRPAEWKSVFPEVNSRIMSLHNLPLKYRLLFAFINAIPASVSRPLLNLF